MSTDLNAQLAIITETLTSRFDKVQAKQAPEVLFVCTHNAGRSPLGPR